MSTGNFYPLKMNILEGFWITNTFFLKSSKKIIRVKN